MFMFLNRLSPTILAHTGDSQANSGGGGHFVCKGQRDVTTKWYEAQTWNEQLYSTSCRRSFPQSPSANLPSTSNSSSDIHPESTIISNKTGHCSAPLHHVYTTNNTMVGFSLSLSTSASVSATTSVNGGTRGYGYQRQMFHNNSGSGVRTIRQNFGEAPVVQTSIYDAQGRPLLIDSNGNYFDAGGNYIGTSGYAGNGRGAMVNANSGDNSGSSGGSSHSGSGQRRNRNSRRGPRSRIISIEDVTEEEERKAAEAASRADGETAEK